MLSVLLNHPYGFQDYQLRPEKILKIAIDISKVDKRLKVLDPKPNIDVKRVISNAGLAACILVSRFIERGRFMFAIGDFVLISKAVNFWLAKISFR